MTENFETPKEDAERQTGKEIAAGATLSSQAADGQDTERLSALRKELNVTFNAGGGFEVPIQTAAAPEAPVEPPKKNQKRGFFGRLFG